MRRLSILSTTLGLLLIFTKLQASNADYSGLFNNSFQANSFNYANQLIDDSTDQSAKNLEYQSNGINQRSYNSFTTAGMPTYPILGSSTVIGLSIYVPVYSNPQPAAAAPANNVQQLQSFSTQRSFAADLQNTMLVNQILDNSSSTNYVNWTSQAANPYASMFGSFSGAGSGFAVLGQNIFNTVPAVQSQAQPLLQRDANGQTFVNTFAAQNVTAGGFVSVSATAIPEPATAGMLALGLITLTAFSLRRRRVPASI